MRFRVLGPIEVVGERGSIVLGGPKQRAVLAHLIVRANQVVTTDALIGLIWGEEPPEAARNSLQSYVSHLRKALGAERLESRTPGYVLHLTTDELDAARFELLLREARGANGNAEQAAGLLREALGLWRGPAFADLAAEEGLSGEIARLDELHIQTLEERLEVDIAAGRHGEVIGELESLVRQQPLRERLWANLMLALYRSGRQADALAAFQRARELLADELGVDPSPELQRLQERILRQDPDLELKGEPLRGYRLLEPIGEGAFGIVYRATQPQIGREVAIKAVHPELANHPDFVRRFEHEAQIVARLEHPHVVPLYDYWREPDAAYLVMRFLRGGSLEDLIDEGPLEPSRAAQILEQVAAALGAAHRQGVVHRDVKPGNVLLDEEGNAYLTDFGVALDAGSPEHTSGMMLRGTPAYLSPEQIRLEPASPRSDIYALGVVLYEMLSGDHPFPETSLSALLDHHLRDALPSVCDARPELPAAVDSAIARATAKDPEDRFADVLEVATAYRAAVEGTRAVREPGGEIRNPYKGLRAFLEADAGDFFGREVLVRRLVARFGDGDPSSRFLAVIGPSGSGKSSVVRAGLVPALRRGALPGSDRWYVIDVLPGPHPLQELESALLGLAVEPPPSLLEELERDVLGLVRAVDRVLPDPDGELLIVLDQLEEIFTLVEADDERRHVLDSLRAATLEPGSRIRIVSTLRADFFDEPLSVPGFGDMLAARTEAITPMSPEELERAIVAPADRAGLVVEPMLLAAMIADVADRPAALPLLQYALTELAERQQDGVLTVDAYRRIGGVSGALARRAEQLYEPLNETAQVACRQLFLRLVTLGEGSEDTRRRVRRSELLPLADARAMATVIDAYGRHRLLSFDRDPSSREPTVEIAHEALLGAWTRLRRWIDEARDDIRTQRQLATAAAEWDTGERDPSFLLHGARLEHAAMWAEATTLALSAADRAYLNASTAQRDEERATEESRLAKERAVERRSVRRLRGLVAVLTAAALVAGILTAVATNQGRRAEREARVASARELAAASVASLGHDAEQSVLLAVRAIETTRDLDGTVLPEAEEALHLALQTDRLLMTISAGTGVVRYSPDGSRLLTTGQEPGTATVYDAQTGRVVLTLSGHGDALLNHVGFSPDGRFISTSEGGPDGSVVVWDADTGQRLLELTVPSGLPVCCWAEFSPDGSVIAAPVWRQDVLTGLFHGRTYLWDTSTGEELTHFNIAGLLGFSPDGTQLWIANCVGDWRKPDLGPRAICVPGPLTDVSWDPDGSRIATSTSDGRAILWDPRTGRSLMTLVPAAASSAYDIEFSPDGHRLAMGFGDGTARIWRLTPTGALPELTITGHESLIQSMKFSPDGTHLATAGEDGTVKVWDVSRQGGAEWLNVPGHGAFAYSPDGEQLVVGQPGGSLAFDDAQTGAEIRTLDSNLTRVTTVAFDADGTRLAAGGPRGAIEIWDLATGERLPSPSVAGSGDVQDIDFSPDGTLLAATSARQWTVVWDAASGQLVHSIPAGKGSVEFSPEGTHLVFEQGGTDIPQDEHVIVWDLATESATYVLHNHFFANVATFSPDGTQIAGGGLDGRIRVWDVSTGALIRTLAGNTAQIWDAAFSPDGRELATASEDGTVRLWDTETGREIATVANTGGQGFRFDIAFSPDGSRLATTSRDGTIHVLALRIEDLLEASGCTADPRVHRSGVPAVPPSRGVPTHLIDRRSHVRTKDRGVGMSA